MHLEAMLIQSGPLCRCRAGKMLIEKLMSGLYMGDCARRLLLSFAQRASLFGDVIPEALTKKDSFSTAGGGGDADAWLALVIVLVD